MEKLELKHYLEFFKNKTHFKITQTTIFNSVLEYQDEIYFDTGIITDICTSDDSKQISGILKLNNGTFFKFDFSLKEDNPEIIPILRKLSDITKEIEHNGEKITPYRWITENYPNCDGFFNWFTQYQHIPITESLVEYCVVQKLIEFHFDVFGLIENGLAIDINTI